MRGRRLLQATMLAFVDLEERVPPNHPLRTIKSLADQALTELSPEFDTMYAETGRPSIPPERLLKAALLIALYSVRSERACSARLAAGRRELQTNRVMSANKTQQQRCLTMELPLLKAVGITHLS